MCRFIFKPSSHSEANSIDPARRDNPSPASSHADNAQFNDADDVEIVDMDATIIDPPATESSTT